MGNFGPENMDDQPMNPTEAYVAKRRAYESDRKHPTGEVGISEQFDRMSDNIAELQDSVERLLMRIQPVLKPEPPESRGDDSKVSTAQCQLSALIEGKTEQIRRITNTIGEATNRIDL